MADKNEGFILTIDAGGSAIKYAIMDGIGEIVVGPLSIPTPQHIEGAGEAKTEALYQEYCGKLVGLYKGFTNAEGGGTLQGIAISHPGVIKSNKLASAGMLKYAVGKDLAADLSAACGGVPVTILNDAKCAAESELARGELQVLQEKQPGTNTKGNGACFVFGSAVGCGVIIDGKVLGGSSGEVSFGLDPNGQYFGLSGSATVFFDRVALALNYPVDETGKPTNVNGKEIFEKYINNKKDYPHKVEVEELFSSYTKGIASMIYTLNCCTPMTAIAFGGAISNQPVFIERVNQEIKKYYNESSLVQIMQTPLEAPVVVACRDHNNANLYGAAINFHRQLRAERLADALRDVMVGWPQSKELGNGVTRSKHRNMPAITAKRITNEGNAALTGPTRK